MASIDTVCFRLINLNRYPQLLGILNRKKAFGLDKETSYLPNPAMMPVEIISKTDLSGKKTQQHKINYITYMPSHSSKLTCLLDHTDDYADFQVSLPKFMYGHNVKMLYNICPPPRPEDACAEGYQAFINAMSALLYTILEMAPPWYDIIITRLDYCMNFLAMDEADALFKINQFKNNKKAYQRVSSPILNTYESEKFSDMASTVFLKSETHSFKIYHKGEEFKKNDYKKVASYNRAEADRLLEIANRTIRFEATFRKRYMSYLFIKQTSPRITGYFLNEETNHQWVQVLKDHLLEPLPSGHTVWSAIQATGEPMDDWSFDHTLKKVANEIHKSLNRNLKFYMDGYTNFNTFGIAERAARFDLSVYTMLGKRFQKFIDEITINTELLHPDTPEKVRKYVMMTMKFTDYEMITAKMFAPRTIYNLRHLTKKWSIKGGGKNNDYDMSAFSSMFSYEGGTGSWY